MFRSKNKTNMFTPVNPWQFYYIKDGCKGVYISRTCLHDDYLNISVSMKPYYKTKFYKFFLHNYNQFSIKSYVAAII